jgi:hypothetical protein
MADKPIQVDGSHRVETPREQEQRIRTLFRSDKGMSKEDMEKFGEKIKKYRPKTQQQVMDLLNESLDEA